MPKVPTYDSLQASPGEAPGARFAQVNANLPSSMPTGAGEIVNKQIGQLGAAMEGAGGKAASILADMEERQNLTRVTAGLNELRRKKIDYTYGNADMGETGYVAQKGDAALMPDTEGNSIGQRYGNKFQESVAAIANNLGNERQRQLFMQHADGMATDFRSGLQEHVLRENNAFNLSTYKASADLHAQEAEINFDKPDLINGAVDKDGVRKPGYIDQMKADISKLSEFSTISATESELMMNNAESTVHRKVISAALAAKNPAYANDYFTQYRDKMNPDDKLNITAKLNTALGQQIATQAVDNTTRELLPRFRPTDGNRLEGIVLGMESGGRDYQPDGVTPTTSKKGALFSMQVMPATAKNPGFGVAPAKDGSAAEYNRVGHEYLAALVNKYGTAPMALAAYNAGPGALDDAMAKAKQKGAPDNWLAELPKETQDYVQKGTAKFNAGLGAPARPTLEEYSNSAVSAALKVNPNLPADAVEHTRTLAEHRYNTISKSLTAESDEAYRQAQQEVVAVKGDLTQVDPNTLNKLSQLKPGMVDDLKKFAGAISKGSVETDPELYATLATYPEEMVKMSDAQFLQLRTRLSESDFKHFANERANYINGKTEDSAGAINGKALTTALSNRLEAVGINPSPKRTDLDAMTRIGTIQKFARDSIYERQGQIGRKLNPQEIEEHVDRLFAKSVTFRKTFLGMNTGQGEQNMMTMKTGDIPSDSADAIRKAFAARGVKSPTDADVLTAYWKWKKKNG